MVAPRLEIPPRRMPSPSRSKSSCETPPFWMERTVPPGASRAVSSGEISRASCALVASRTRSNLSLPWYSCSALAWKDVAAASPPTPETRRPEDRSSRAVAAVRVASETGIPAASARVAMVPPKAPMPTISVRIEPMDKPLEGALPCPAVHAPAHATCATAGIIAAAHRVVPGEASPYDSKGENEMTTFNAKKRVAAAATALAALFAVGLPQRAYADEIKPPPVPANIKVPAGNEAFLVGHAVGTQNY